MGRAAAQLRRLFDAAVAAAQPGPLVAAALPAPPRGRTVVLGLGKAAWAMGAAVEAAWPPAAPLSGVLVAPAGSPLPALQRLRALASAHPQPDARSLAAAQALLQACQGLGPEDQVIALISGGASALATLPLPGLSLAELQAVNAGLLRAGAPIAEINAVRKQLCALKGGRLAQACGPRVPLLSLLLSDIPGDRLDLIGSGPTLADPGSADQALTLLRRHGLLTPALQRSLQQRETLKRLPAHHQARLLASPALALQAAAQAARGQGLPVHLGGDALEGEARALGARLALDCLAPGLHLSGGETTVTLAADARPGEGGRNAECLLAAFLIWRGRPGVHGLMADSDGIDGASDAAGACCGPAQWQQARELGLDPLAHLDAHDAGGFWRRLGAQLRTGPTGTNVNDFRAILVEP